MCLAVAAQVTEISGLSATVEIDGVSCQISCMLLPDLQLGDWVLVHAGFAMQRLEREQAKQLQAAYHTLTESGYEFA